MRRFTKLLGTVPRLLATLLMVATSVMFTGGSAGAVMGCGEFSYGFDAVTLSNDSINTVNGPFDIELPAGTYDVVFQTCTATDDVNQQWYVALDSGYVSPTTLDIAEDDTIDFAVVEQAPTVAVLPSVQMTQPVGTAIETFGAPSRILLAVGALALIASGAFVVLGTRSAPFTG